MLRQDAGIEHRHHHAFALGDVPRRRRIDAAGSAVQMPLVLRVVRIVRHQLRGRVARAHIGALKLHVHFGVLHGGIGLDLGQHLLQFGRAQAALQADQIGPDTELAHDLRVHGTGTTSGGATDTGAGDRRLHGRQLGRTIRGRSGAGAVLDDDALCALGGSRLAHRLLGRQARCIGAGACGQRQHGGCQHIDAKVLLTGHVDVLFKVMDQTTVQANTPCELPGRPWPGFL
ncbi:hypothetical protein D3C71_1499260 [compost metagenome]